MDEIKDFQLKFLEFWKTIEDPKKAPKPWREYLPLSTGVYDQELEAAAVVFSLTFYSAEPTPINTIQAFKMLRNIQLVEKIMMRIDLENNAYAGAKALDRIKRAKKKSKQMGCIDLD